MSLTPLTPASVKPGDTIGVMAPSSYVEKDDIERSSQTLRDLGYKIHVHPQTYLKAGQMAGRDEEKIAALHELFIDSNIKAIWFAGGGNRALKLVDRLDYSLIRDNPKAVLGFSDNTALLNAISAQTGLITYHAEVFKNLSQSNSLHATLEALSFHFPSQIIEAENIVNNQSFNGRIIGGNLSVFHYLAGTTYYPSSERTVLFLEDCNDELSRLDRMLIHLERCGMLEKISGILLGYFSNITNSGKYFAETFSDVLGEYIDLQKTPIIKGLKSGHNITNFPIPINGLAHYDSKEKRLQLTM